MKQLICKTVALIFVLLFMTSSVLYADTDNIAPKVSNLTISPQSASVNDTITIATNISDANGVKQDVIARIFTPTMTEVGKIPMSLVSGDTYNGDYQGTFQIPDGYSAGEWNVAIYAYDNYSNWSLDMETLDYTTSFTVTGGTTDTTAPQVSNLMVNPSSADINSIITISANLSDENGIQQDVIARIFTPTMTEVGKIPLSLVSGDTYNGDYQGTFQIPEGYSAGEWNVTIYAYDNYSNWSLNMETLDYTTSFTVTGGTTDTTAPQVSNLMINPSSADINSIITISANLSDENGIQQDVIARIFTSTMTEVGKIPMSLVSGDTYNGDYQGTFQIPEGYSAGKWNVTIYAYDNYSNWSLNMETLDYTTSFTVNDYILESKTLEEPFTEEEPATEETTVNEIDVNGWGISLKDPHYYAVTKALRDLKEGLSDYFSNINIGVFDYEDSLILGFEEILAEDQRIGIVENEDPEKYGFNYALYTNLLDDKGDKFSNNAEGIGSGVEIFLDKSGAHPYHDNKGLVITDNPSFIDCFVQYNQDYQFRKPELMKFLEPEPIIEWANMTDEEFEQECIRQGVITRVYTDSETIKNVQEALNQAGFDCGTPDGSAGPATQAALNAFQETKGLTITSDITAEVLIALGLL